MLMAIQTIIYNASINQITLPLSVILLACKQRHIKAYAHDYIAHLDSRGRELDRSG